MTRERGLHPSRNRAERRLIMALAFVITGFGGGALLGMIAIGKGLDREVREAASFAGLSANPDALVADVTEAPVGCPGCVDTYAVAARMRAARESRMDEPFRRLGKVDVDTAPPPEPDDGYRYGGRLPDPEPPTAFARRDMPATAVPAALSTIPAPAATGRKRIEQQKGPGDMPEPSAISEPE